MTQIIHIKLTKNLEYIPWNIQRFCCALFYYGSIISLWYIYMIHLPIFSRVASLTLGQSYDCPSVSKVPWRIWVTSNRYQTTIKYNETQIVHIIQGMYSVTLKSVDNIGQLASVNYNDKMHYIKSKHRSKKKYHKSGLKVTTFFIPIMNQFFIKHENALTRKQPNVHAIIITLFLNEDLDTSVLKTLYNVPKPSWRHDSETLSVLLALCECKPSVTSNLSTKSK